MAQKTTILKGESKKSLPEIADFLSNLAKDVRKGNVNLTQAGEKTTINLPQICELEIKFDKKPKGKAKKYSLEIEIDWVEGEKHGGEVKLA